MYRLTRNCRNTPSVAEYIVKVGGLEPGYSYVLRPDSGPQGTPRISYYSSDEQQLALMRSAIRGMTASGEFACEDVVVLSPKKESCAERHARSGEEPALVRFPDQAKGACSYSTVAAFKGLEAPAVVLTDIDDLSKPWKPSLFYVAVSRATDRLHILVKDDLRAEVKKPLQGVRKRRGCDEC